MSAARRAAFFGRFERTFTDLGEDVREKFYRTNFEEMMGVAQ